eukprot:Hpha_TRINITY_DN14621_c0_g1::TRINITY_DN14621_c0_g1_i2::g.47654::m.47654
MRFVVVGAGVIGREFAVHHLGTPTGTNVVALVDTSVKAAECLAEELGAKLRTRVPHFCTLSEALSKLAVDAVYIGTPPGSHCRLVDESLRAGKHVLLEKPLAASPEHAEAIVAATREFPSARLCVDIGMRWNKAVHHMKRLLE